MNDASGSSPRILLIDDDSMMVELLSALFEHRGYETLALPSADEALPALRDPAQHFDVILSDLHMPGLEGRDLTTSLAAARRLPTLLIGMSGKQPNPAEIEPLDAFLLKPFSPEHFDETVAQIRQLRAARPVHETQAVPPTIPPADAPILNLAVFENLRRALGDETLRQTYDMLLDDTAKRLTRMEIALAASDADTIRREAHAIKGSAGMVGATELHILATAAEGGATDSTPPIADFRSACQRLQRMLDETLAH
jgi:CheY-like chemotaxis protein